MPGKANRSLAASADEADGLVFSWTRRHRGAFWLWGFLVLSLLLHAAGFYMFQVVYPSSGRLEPFPARVLILDKKNPANALMLKELNDRLVFLQPASVGSTGRKSIDGFAVSFQPSFVKRAPPFREPVVTEQIPEPSPAMSLPAKLSILPPFRAQDYARSVASDTSVSTRITHEKPAILRRWALHGDLARRTLSVAQAEVLDKTLPAIGEGPEIVMAIAVDAAGSVKQVTVKSGNDHPNADEFVKAVKMQLKFDPLPDSGLTNGELVIRK